MKITEEKDGLEVHSQKLTEEASYAKELAAAAAVELQNLAEEVTKLTYQNAKLTADLAAAKEASCGSNCCQRPTSSDLKQNSGSFSWLHDDLRKTKESVLVEELRQELNRRYQREASLVSALSEKDKVEDDLQRKLDEAKRHEEDLENELANMWVLVAKMRKSGMNSEEVSCVSNHAFSNLPMVDGNGFSSSNSRLTKIYEENKMSVIMDGKNTFEELEANYHRERRKCKELETLVLRLKVCAFLASVFN